MSTDFQDTDAQKGWFSGLYERTGKPSNNDGNYRSESIGFPIVQPLGKLYLNNAYFIYTTVVIVIALWVISAVMLFSSNEEKAILAEIE